MQVQTIYVFSGPIRAPSAVARRRKPLAERGVRCASIDRSRSIDRPVSFRAADRRRWVRAEVDHRARARKPRAAAKSAGWTKRNHGFRLIDLTNVEYVGACAMPDRSRDRRPPSPSRSMPIDGAIDAIDRARSTPFDAFRPTRSIDASRFARDRSRTRAARARAHRRADARRRATRARRRATRGATDDARAMEPSTTASEVRARGERRGRAMRARRGRRAGRSEAPRVARGRSHRCHDAAMGGDRGFRRSGVARRADGGRPRRRWRDARARGGGETGRRRRRSERRGAAVVGPRARRGMLARCVLSVSRAFARRLTVLGDVVLARRRALGPIRRFGCGVAPTSRNTSRR